MGGIADISEFDSDFKNCVQFDEEDQEFGEDYLSDKDPSILHFLLASGDEVGPLLLT